MTSSKFDSIRTFNVWGTRFNAESLFNPILKCLENKTQIQQFLQREVSSAFVFSDIKTGNNELSLSLSTNDNIGCTLPCNKKTNWSQNDKSGILQKWTYRIYDKGQESHGASEVQNFSYLKHKLIQFCWDHFDLLVSIIWKLKPRLLLAESLQGIFHQHRASLSPLDV